MIVASSSNSTTAFVKSLASKCSSFSKYPAAGTTLAKSNVFQISQKRLVSLRRPGGELTPFSKSQAYLGVDKASYVDLNQPVYIPDFYDSRFFRNLKMWAVFSSIGAIILYLAFREPNDVDEVLEAPPELFYTNMQKMVLRDKLRQATSMGNTKEAKRIKVELDYNTILDAETRIKYQKEQEELEKRGGRVNRGFGILNPEPYPQR